MRIFFSYRFQQALSGEMTEQDNKHVWDRFSLLAQGDVPRTGRKGIDTMPGQSMNIPDTTLTPISFNGFCRKRLLSRMVSPVRQALFQFGYRYVRKRHGELLES